MTKKEEDFIKRLHEIFKVEAEEHINKLSVCLIELEKNPKNKISAELIETIFREAHSLKGAARSVNRNDIESICQILENTFAKLKAGTLILSPAHFDIIHKAFNTISKMLSETQKKISDDNKELIAQITSFTESEIFIKQTEEKQSEPIKPFIEKTDQILIKQNKTAEQTASTEDIFHQLETIRIQTSKLDSLFLQAEQMIQSKVAATQRTADLKHIYEFISSWKTQLNKWDSIHIADPKNHLKELINWTKEKLDETEKNIYSVTHEIDIDQRTLGRMIDEHVESMQKVLMLPISIMIEVFPRLIRDIARSQGKEIELIIHGKETEVDKRILEELKDPLIHLIRNCIDHGIKNPEERLKLKKQAHGTLTLNFTVVDGRFLEIIISDDGAGINVEKVISSALKSGIISNEDVTKITQQESFDLIFKSGISTSPMITDISGRGLGLAIVHEKVEKLGGKITVESKTNIGTTFRMQLPLSLSTFRGVMVRTGEYFFFIPTARVERAIRVNKEMIKTVENKETVLINQKIIAITKLSDLLGIRDKVNLKSTQSMSDFIQIVVLSQIDNCIGLKVDEVYDEHQILVKDLGKQLRYVKNISGATVLGSGKVVPVLNVDDLIQTASNNISSSGITEDEKQSEIKIFKILVTDDSLTSRSLIKIILESSFLLVVTGVDGIDAYTKALTEEFDMIVSDVDMPRLNGFELTAKVRKNKKLAEIPVVLVTALETREDREHGIDVGANAYIVKSSFDQSNLLEVVKRLL